jgi:cytolysin (calcineurin-like family phosphatase)
MKAHNTIVVAIIGVFALVSAPSQASEILTCKYAGWLEVVTSENKDKLEKEGFVPVPNDPQVMFKSQLPPKSFQVATDRMRWDSGVNFYGWSTTPFGATYPSSLYRRGRWQ